MITKEFKKLEQEINDIKKYINQDKIMVIPINKYSKKPKDFKWNTKNYELKHIANYNGNYGIKIGYNHNKHNMSLAVVDIDGLKEDHKEATADYIYECLKDLGGLVVQTQSGGKHLYFWNKTVNDKQHETSKKLNFPPVEVLPDTLKEVGNKNLKDSIEIFTKEASKQCVLPSSSILDEPLIKEILSKNNLLYPPKIDGLKKENKGFSEEEIVNKYNLTNHDFNKLTDKVVEPYKKHIKKYKVIGDVKTLSDIKVVEDVNKLIYDTLITKGFTPAPEEEPKKETNTGDTTLSNNNLKNLSNLEIEKMVECFREVVKHNTEKHNFSLYLGGFLSENITKKSCIQLLDKIKTDKTCTKQMENVEAFIKTVLNNYDKPNDKKKAGLPKLINEMEKYPDIGKNTNLNKLENDFRRLCNPKNITYKKQLPSFSLYNFNNNKNECDVYGVYNNNEIKIILFKRIAKDTDFIIDINKEVGIFEHNNKTVSLINKMKISNGKLDYGKEDNNSAIELLENEGIKLNKKFMKQVENYIFDIYEENLKPQKTQIETFTSNTGTDKLNYTDEFTIINGPNQEGKAYGLKQNNKGIYKFSGDKLSLLGNMQIGHITRKIDLLELFDPEYYIEYYSITDNKYYNFNGTENDFKEKIKLGGVLKEKKDINTIFNTFILYGSNNKWIDIEETVFKKGFFMHDNELIDNSEIKDIKYTNEDNSDNEDLKYTNEDVKEAITMFNEILRNESIGHECNIYRFMLGMPFSYCLKQLGHGESCYGLILTGTAGTNKTGACMNGSRFYGLFSEENTVNTVSVFGKKLELDTYPKIIDEAYEFYNRDDTTDSLKTCIYEKTIRSVSDMDNQDKIKTNKALSMPILIMNDPIKDVRPEISRRYKVFNYTKDMVVSKEDKNKFREEYVPRSEDSKLNKLKFIGAMFRDKLKPYLENKDKRNELIDYENLVIKILKEISKEVGVDFNKNMYEIAEVTKEVNIEPDEEIRRCLNESFKDIRRKNYRSSDLDHNLLLKMAKNNDFTWLKYQQGNNAYIIHSTELVKFINTELRTTHSIKDIIEYLQVPLDEIDTNKTFNKIITVKDKQYRGIRITNTFLILEYFFNINVGDMGEDTNIESEKVENIY